MTQVRRRPVLRRSSCQLSEAEETGTSTYTLCRPTMEEALELTWHRGSGNVLLVAGQPETGCQGFKSAGLKTGRDRLAKNHLADC